MAKRKELTATQKLRKLVHQQIRRMEKRGYRVLSDIKEKVKTGKYQTLKSIQRNKYKKLFESSTAEIDGKVVTGQKKRSVERSETAKKAAVTRQRRKQLKETGYSDRDIQDYERYQKRKKESESSEWERLRRIQDEIDKRNADLYNEGKIAFSQINELIDEYPTPGSKMLKKALSSEISKYGEQKVVQAIGNAPSSFIAQAQQIVYYEEESDAIHSALVSFFEVITGTILDASQAKEIGNTMDEMTDFATYG